MLLQVGRAIPTSPWELVLTSSRETKFVLAILVLFSIASWYFIVLKWWQFRRMRAHADRFMVEIEKAARLEDAYHAAMRLPSSPYNRLLREGIHFFSQLRPGGLQERGEGPAVPTVALTTTQLEALRMVLAKEVAAERDAAARFIPWLATFGSVSPLLGLLGTVHGLQPVREPARALRGRARGLRPGDHRDDGPRRTAVRWPASWAAAGCAVTASFRSTPTST